MSGQAGKACFFCNNSHIAGLLPCDCACHQVEPLWNRLRAIYGEMGWTIPQLLVIKKLLDEKAKR